MTPPPLVPSRTPHALLVLGCSAAISCSTSGAPPRAATAPAADSPAVTRAATGSGLPHDSGTHGSAPSSTPRSIVLEAIVALPLEQAFDLWLTPAGVRRFLAPMSRIDPRDGGEYTIVFDPENDPNGEAQGTRGARILHIERPTHLSFEWTMPPFAASLDGHPLPTWVELTFAPVGDPPSRTRVRLEHHGFGSGDEWSRAYAWFRDIAWAGVMRRLEQIQE